MRKRRPFGPLFSHPPSKMKTTRFLLSAVFAACLFAIPAHAQLIMGTAETSGTLPDNDNDHFPTVAAMLTYMSAHSTGIAHGSAGQVQYTDGSGNWQSNSGFTSDSSGNVVVLTLNGNTITTGSGTLALGAGKTITFNHTSTFTTTDAQTYTFPTTSATLARTDAGNAFTGNQSATGSILSSHATAGVGYATGAGGTVTQITSRTTGVTINKASGAITLFSAAGSATPATFTVTDSAVAATDVVVVNQKSGTDTYEIFVTAVGASSFNVTFFTTGGTTTEQPVFSFAVIKGVSS